MSQEEFLGWMIKNAHAFKGYQMQALHYFELYVDEMLTYLEKKEKKELSWLLQMTDYSTWKQKNFQPEEEIQENVRRYLRHASRRKFPLDKELYKNILRTLQLAYPKKENHHLIIQYLYFGKHISEKTPKPRYFRMTDKRMSDLLRMAAHKEKEMRLSWQYARLMKKEPQTQEERSLLLQTEKQLREAKGRVALLTRADLLPLIHFVSQERYLEQHAEEEYQQEEAVEYFVNLADATLRTCGMEPVSKKFSIDYLLLACFKENEMLTFSEILDQTGELGMALQSD